MIILPEIINLKTREESNLMSVYRSYLLSIGPLKVCVHHKELFY